MKVVIIKYNAGNIRSVTFALERIGIEPLITDDVNEIISADKVIFPGVGEASSAMIYLREKMFQMHINKEKNFAKPLRALFVPLITTDCVNPSDRRRVLLPSKYIRGLLPRRSGNSL